MTFQNNPAAETTTPNTAASSPDVAAKPSVTGEAEITAAATDPTVTTNKPDLGAFLEWSYSFNSPFDADFLREFNQSAQQLNELKAGPHKLGEHRGVTWRLDYLVSLLLEERDRLTKVSEEYHALRGQVELNYGEAEVLEWLHQNRPAIYERLAGATTHSNNDKAEVETETETTNSTEAPKLYPPNQPGSDGTGGFTDNNNSV